MAAQVEVKCPESVRAKTKRLGSEVDKQQATGSSSSTLFWSIKTLTLQK